MPCVPALKVLRSFLSGRAEHLMWAPVLALPSVFLLWIVGCGCVPGCRLAAMCPTRSHFFSLPSLSPAEAPREAVRFVFPLVRPAACSALGHSSPPSLQDLTSRWRDTATSKPPEPPARIADGPTPSPSPALPDNTGHSRTRGLSPRVSLT